MPSGVFTLKQVEQAIGQGAWTNQPPISVNYLVVAGGGGGGKSTSGGAGAANGGGGGGGGLLQGTFGITAGTSYTVTVGSGGAGGGGSDGIGADGSNSVFGPISSTGGGGGGNSSSAGGNVGRSGGSGGGAGGGNVAALGGSGISGQGNRGGASTYAASAYGTGGGGGAGTIGLDGTSSVGGNGGAGVASDISGTRTAYSGGGGGSGYNGNGTAGTGGAGGGGSGSINGSTPGGAGSGNTGGGGGGGSFTVSGTVISNGGNGGSGVVIVSYPGTTQWFTGGTLSYGNGNIVHSFYSSGTLAPTTPSTYVDTGYQISRSLRFNSADSAYLNRTPASAGNRKTYTFSGWVKVAGNPGNYLNFFLAQSGGIYAYLSFNNSNNIEFASTGDGSTLITSAVYRDYSAWYHIVLAVDTTQATASNRIKLYVNGSQITSFSTETYPSQNADTQFNTTLPHFIGSNATPGNFFIGYATEINFIDGQALTPQSFGYYNPDTGVWSPLKFVGTYGTNGFYLNFSDNSNTTAATLGKDYSGNGNNWTPNNFSVSAGAGNDSLVDTPTPYGVDTGAGGTVRGNYCTWNPLLIESAAGRIATLANGNLQASNSSNNNSTTATATIGMSSGKWYWEITVGQAGNNDGNWVGVLSAANTGTSTFRLYNALGQYYNGTSWASYGASFTANDVIGIALDVDNQTITFYKNNASQGQKTSIGISGLTMVAAYSCTATGENVNANFGQRPFAYTAPSGFKALCTQNLPTPTIGATTATQASQYFAPVIYTGTGAAQTITVGFQPDFVWLKSRVSAVWYHQLYDVIRTPLKALFSNATDAETTYTDTLTAFASNGFSLGTDATYNGPVNKNGDTYVSWNWKANGAGSSNTAGSITSTVSANTTSGFSIVTWTGNSANATIGHGLGVAPSMYIIKYRGTTDNWYVYHASTGANKYLVLNSTDLAQTNTNIWQNTAPTSTVFSIGSGNNNSTIVAYCFAAVSGFSAFGSYTGNGSTDGPFVYTGFRPAFILIKRTDTGGTYWLVRDASRSPNNVVNLDLYPNATDAENSSTANDTDFLSNGFKLRNTGTGSNTSAGTYIYMAFATSPFKYSIAR